MINEINPGLTSKATIFHTPYSMQHGALVLSKSVDSFFVPTTLHHITNEMVFFKNFFSKIATSKLVRQLFTLFMSWNMSHVTCIDHQCLFVLSWILHIH